jgi:hypothetical protein
VAGRRPSAPQLDAAPPAPLHRRRLVPRRFRLAVALNRVTLAAHRPRAAVASLAGGFACGLAFIALLALDADVAPDGAGLAGVLIALLTALTLGAVLIVRRA